VTMTWRDVANGSRWMRHLACRYAGSRVSEETGVRVETAVWVLIAQRSYVRPLLPLLVRPQVRGPFPSQEGASCCATRDHIRDRNRLEWALRRWDGGEDRAWPETFGPSEMAASGSDTRRRPAADLVR
jgi:hypothetical protein